MKRSAIALALSLFLAPTERVAAQDSLSISPTLLRLTMSIGRNTSGLWKWNLDSTPEGRAEYVWSARLEGDTTFSIGFMLFKMPGARPREGDFDALLRAGQTNIAYVVRHREQPLHQVRLIVNGADSSLVVELRNAQLIAQIVARRPEWATFASLMPDLPSSVSRRVRIRYDGF